MIHLRASSETKRKRSQLQRMTVVHGLLLVLLLILVARLIELQVVNGDEYYDRAQKQHFGRITLPARRGDILGVSSKTGERTIFATNTTLDLVYVDPVTANPPKRESNAVIVAETLADILLTPVFHDACNRGKETCPRELIPFYIGAFDPLTRDRLLGTGALLAAGVGPRPPPPPTLPDFIEAKRLFARNIERRIREKRVTFAPLKYGATKPEFRAVEAMRVRGLSVRADQGLIYANPEEIPQSSLGPIARALAAVLQEDPEDLRELLRARDLQYVPIMRRLPPPLSLKIKEAQLTSLKDTMARFEPGAAGQLPPEALQYPLRGIALVPEHPRFYPDTTVASQVIGFLNAAGDPQYGVERTFHPLLRGRQGSIATVRDPQGGQILTATQTIEKPRDGDTVVLTIDRTIQKELEGLMDDAVRQFKAESGQAIVMDPATGRVLAMVNAPLFDSNRFADVYAKEVIPLDGAQERNIVLELFHPETNARIMTGYVRDAFTGSGRSALSERLRKTLDDLEKLYDLRDLARYWHYLNTGIKREVFPTGRPGVWLKYRNDLGVGAYLNRTIQEMYEPGSVLKPITMAIALDQGEVRPDDTYDDVGPVKMTDPSTGKSTFIRNALLKHYGRVNMTTCIGLSINTCMTYVSSTLGRKLFHRSLERFGFGQITGIELEDELAGTLKHWRNWAEIDLASISFGQAISATPMQMITAWSALANGGKLLKPTIVDRVIHADGTEDVTPVRLVEQVIKSKTAETITAMLVNSAETGFARAGKPAGYRVAAKTGTSQIALPSGRGYESGTGTTIATFAGYAPVDRPRFVVLVKLDRPKTTIFGVDAAAPVFKKIATFLFNYYGIQPDAK